MNLMQFKKSFILFLASIAWLSAASGRADDVQFTAGVDRDQVAEDESLSLKIVLKSPKMVRLSGDPKYSAPDFALVSEYPSQNYETVYANGQFSMQTTLAFTYILRPKKRGTFKITGIELSTQDGQTYRGSPLTVTVVAGGAGTPPPQNYGSGGSGLRGAAKRNTGGMSFFIRAEVDKNQAYKGERIVVSYYLYTRVRIYNIRADKFPTLEGFLREELEMPLITPKAGEQPEQVVVGGVPYQRSLLARYAAFPLKEGKLSIDSMSLQVDYFAQGRENSAFGEDDPFAGFFNQLMPRKATATSDLLGVEILAVPQEGKPASFTGGIGQFTVLSSLDRSEVKTGEPVTFSVKVEGQGNLASIDPPKVNWPDGVQVYESTAHITGGKTGAGQKSFDTVLVFKKPGTITIPAVDFSYFDPKTKSYSSAQTRPLQVVVSGNAIAEAETQSATQATSEKTPGDTAFIDRWMSQVSPVRSEQTARTSSLFANLERGVRMISLLLLALTGVLAIQGWRKTRTKKVRVAPVDHFDPQRVWNKAGAELRHLSSEPGRDALMVKKSLESAEDVFARVLNHRFGLNPRVYSGSEYSRLLQEEKNLPAERAEAIQALLMMFQELKYSDALPEGGRLKDLSDRWQRLGLEDPAFVQEAEAVSVLIEDRDEASILGIAPDKNSGKS